MPTNKSTKSTAVAWAPNAKQSAFLKAVAEHPGCTLAEAAKAMGMPDLKSGSVNCLVSKGLVVTEDVEVEEVVTRKKKVKAYRLAGAPAVADTNDGNAE